MMRIYGIFAALLFMTFFVSGCGSDGSSEAKCPRVWKQMLSGWKLCLRKFQEP